MKIYKYGVPDDHFDGFLDIPSGAEILSTGVQVSEFGGRRRHHVFIWALVDPDAPVVRRRIISAPTGYVDLDVAGLDFIGTVQMPNGLVWHVFDGGEG